MLISLEMLISLVANHRFIVQLEYFAMLFKECKSANNCVFSFFTSRRCVQRNAIGFRCDALHLNFPHTKTGKWRSGCCLLARKFEEIRFPVSKFGAHVYITSVCLEINSNAPSASYVFDFENRIFVCYFVHRWAYRHWLSIWTPNSYSNPFHVI